MGEPSHCGNDLGERSAAEWHRYEPGDWGDPERRSSAGPSIRDRSVHPSRSPFGFRIRTASTISRRLANRRKARCGVTRIWTVIWLCGAIGIVRALIAEEGKQDRK